MSVHSAEIATNVVQTTAEKTIDKAFWSLYLYQSGFGKRYSLTL